MDKLNQKTAWKSPVIMLGRISQRNNRSVRIDHGKPTWATWFWRINECLCLFDSVFLKTASGDERLRQGGHNQRQAYDTKKRVDILVHFLFKAECMWQDVLEWWDFTRKGYPSQGDAHRKMLSVWSRCISQIWHICVSICEFIRTENGGSMTYFLDASFILLIWNTGENFNKVHAEEVIV